MVRRLQKWREGELRLGSFIQEKNLVLILKRDFFPPSFLMKVNTKIMTPFKVFVAWHLLFV